MSFTTGPLDFLPGEIRKYISVHQICPCHPVFTAHVIPSRVVSMASGNVTLECTIFPDSDFHRSHFGGTCLDSSRCAHDIEKSFLVQITDNQWQLVVSPMKDFLVVNAVLKNGIVSTMDVSSGVLPHPSHRHHDSAERQTVIELFSGGFSGWSHACKAANRLGYNVCHALAIDHDTNCAEAYMKSHGLGRLIHHNDLTVDLDNMHDGFFVCCDVTKAGWYHLHADNPVTMMFMSPPCPPWSFGSHMPGFHHSNGLLTLHAWGIASLFQPRIIAMEMVSSILRHEHWPILRSFICWCGYDIKWQKVSSLHEVCPQHRDRLLIIAIRRGDMDLNAHSCVTWPIVKQPSLQSFCALCSIDDELVQQSIPEHQILKMYLDPSNFPRRVGDNNLSSKRSRKEFEGYRIKFPDQSVACVMANYSFSHLLPQGHIEKGGLFGSLIFRPSGLRFLAVHEVLVLFAPLSRVWLPCDRRTAIHLLGNAISGQHAAICLANMIAFLKVLNQQEVQQLFMDLTSERMHMDNMSWKFENDGILFSFGNQDGSMIPATIPVHSFATIVIQTPTGCMKIRCDVVFALAGKSTPGMLYILHDGIYDHKIVMPNDFMMPSCDLMLWSDLPCALMLNATYCDETDENLDCIIVLLKELPLAIKRIDKMSIKHVRETVEMLGLIPDECIFKSVLGSVFRDSNRTPTCVVACIQHQLPADLSILDIVQIRYQDHHLNIRGNSHDLGEFINLLAACDLDVALQAMGWMLCQPASFPNDDREKQLLILPSPGRFALLPENVGIFIMSRIFALWLNRTFDCHFLDPDVIWIRFKLWDSCIWEGCFPKENNVSAWMHQWNWICRMFNIDCPIRFVVHGKSFDHECPVRAILTDTDLSNGFLLLFAVTALHGGGSTTDEDPSSVSIPRDVVTVPSTNSEISLEEVDFTAMERADFGQTVARMISQWIGNRLYQGNKDILNIHGLRVILHEGMVFIEGNLDDSMTMLQILSDEDVISELEAFGWITSVQFVRCRNPTITRIALIPKPRVQAVSCDAIRAFLQTVFFVLGLPRMVSPSDEAIFVRIKLWGEVVFREWIHRLTPLGHIVEAWDHANSIIQHYPDIRLVCNGSMANPDFAIKHFARKNDHDTWYVNIYCETSVQGGGGANVADQIVRQKNDLAAFLLAEGGDLNIIATFVDALVKNAGHQTIASILGQKHKNQKWEGIFKTANSLSITIPDFVSRALQSQKRFADKIKKQHKDTLGDVPIHEFAIKSDALKYQDGSPCQQIPHVIPNANGVVLIKGQEAAEWLSKTQPLSQEELALAVVGTCPGHSKDTCNRGNLPAHDGQGYPVVLSVCIHNIGKKDITVNVPNNSQVPVKESAVVSWTVFRDECGHEAWSRVIQSPVKTTLELAFGSDSEFTFLSPPWGRSYHKDRLKVEASQATSMQFHARVASTDLVKALRCSGTGGVYTTPKTENKQICQDYQVVWLNFSASDLAVSKAAYSNHFGIVRNTKIDHKVSRGLRFKKEDFISAFQELRPGDQPPSIVAANFMYKLTPVPIGVTHEQVTKWMENQTWRAKPIRALANDTWLIAAEEQLEVEFAAWNSQTILVKAIQKRANNTPVIVAGNVPRAGKSGNGRSNGVELHKDPWADFLANKGNNSSHQGNASSTALPPAVAKKMEASIEQKFDQQFQEIQAVKTDNTKEIEMMRQDVQKLRETVEKQAAHHQTHCQFVEKEFTKVRHETEDRFNGMKNAFQDSLSSAMDRQESKMMNQFNELRNILLERPNPAKKAKSAPRDAFMEQNPEGQS